MLPIAFDDITPDDIMRLVTDKVSERTTLEFKKALNIGNTDSAFLLSRLNAIREWVSGQGRTGNPGATSIRTLTRLTGTLAFALQASRGAIQKEEKQNDQTQPEPARGSGRSRLKRGRHL